MSTISGDGRDTIFAIATGAGRSAIAIVRVSGPACPTILAQMCPNARFRDRRATLVRILDQSRELIDQGVVIHFPVPHSFTGEDLVEFQVTGSRAVLAALVRSLSKFSTTRPAQPGEFARRAFENGKRDLAEVEGLSRVVEAETAAQLRHAQRVASGELSRACENIREQLLQAMVLVESNLDFSDVEDTAAISSDELMALLEDARAAIRRLLLNARAGERVRDGMTVVIAGAPNVGKSSLMNVLAGRDVSMVSTIPGTTRDLIEISTEIDGFPIVFVDTAGLRESDDPLESEGIARARRRCASADLTLWLTNFSDADPPIERVGGNVLHVKSKLDLAPQQRVTGGKLAFSAKTGEGVDSLLAAICEFAAEFFSGSGEALIGTERQRLAIVAADAALGRVISKHQQPVEIVAEELRAASLAMSRVVGRIDVEDVLDEVFSRLCVGK
jgi:tRNA modification GTPase